MLATFIALPDDLGPDSRFLSANVQLTPLEAEEARWLLRLAIVRDPNPPEEVVGLSRLIGGYPGVLARLAANWPTNKTRMGLPTGGRC
jgi:hypothetical protein